MKRTESGQKTAANNKKERSLFSEREAYGRTLAALLPSRPHEGHKGSFGRVSLVCGSPSYTGAAILAAAGALRMGCGLVFLYAPPEVTAPLRVALPEVIAREMPPVTEEGAAYLPILRDEAWDAILIGCGIGQTDHCGVPASPDAFAEMLDSLLVATGCPIVLDADALNLLAHACGVSGLTAAARLRRARRPVVITPHPMEFSRMSGLSLAEISADRVGVARRFANESGATLLLKGAGTVIASPEGEVAVNPSGSTALAKGGSGDVLAGMLASFLAQGIAPYAAARLAAYLHGIAGEEEAAVYSARGVLPSELPRAAARVLCRLEAHAALSADIPQNPTRML